MNTTISIRPAEPDDIPTIGFLAQQVWPRAYGDILSKEQLSYMLHLFYSPDSLRKQMLEDRHVFLVVEEDEDPIGFASYSGTTEPGIYKLHKLYILPGRQGKGLGNTLLGFIFGEIGPLGAKAMRLNVNRYNKARQFYEKLGFSVIGQEDNAIGNNYFMNDYVMEKLL
jgi:GNAT superfamily N-acetyltransferase